MRDWIDNRDVSELLNMRKEVLSLSVSECSQNTGVWKAVIEGRILKIFESHPEKELLAQEIRKIEYNPVLDWDWEDGEMVATFTRADEIRGDLHEILTSEFKYKLSTVLLSCVTSLVSESTEMPNFVTPSIDLSFVKDKSSHELLQVRWDEAYKCRKLDLEMSGVVMLVSFVEGLLGILFEKLLTKEEVEKHGSTKDYEGNKVILPVERWTLDMLFAASQKILDLRKEFWPILRLCQSLRNEIHPMKAKASQTKLSMDDLDLVWVAAQLLVPSAKRFYQSRTPA